MEHQTSSLLLAAALAMPFSQSAVASGHGPVFGLATPTNPKGGWSFDTSFMGRGGDGFGAMIRPALGYGLSENLKLSISAPAVFQAEPFAPGRLAGFTPMGNDVEGLAIWRFHRQDTGIGSRSESAVIGGVLVPGPQNSGGTFKRLHSGPGALIGGVTGIASRSHYAWVGATYQRYASSKGDRRPDLLFYSFAYAYRPPSWRRDNGWDWRIFGEMTGELAGHSKSAGQPVRGSDSHQVFVGPATLGVYKNYAVSAGVQFPAYQAVASPVYPRERVRFALNFAYFF